MFTNTYLPHVGGVARSIYTFVSDLRAAGHSVLIVAPVFPDCEAHDTSEEDILRVPAITEMNGSEFSMRLPVPFFVSEAIEKFKPDIIHSHHPYLMGDSAFRAARQRLLPLVFTHHTLYEEYTHHMNMDVEAIQQFAANISTQYAALCDHIIAPSKSISDLLMTRGVDKQISVIPTGVDIPFFSDGNGNEFRKDHNISEKTFVIGHVGRLAAEKNLEFLTQAAARAVKNRPDTLFLVVGDGPVREKIQTIFSAHHVADRLFFTGSLSGKALADAYHAMDLFVFSSFSETQGMVLTEAMAAGVPVMALDGPGVKDVIIDEHNGILLPGQTTPDDFSTQIEKTIVHPERLTQWKNGVMETAERFSRKKSAETLIQLYKTLKARHRKLLSAQGENPDPKTDAWNAILLGVEAEWDLMVEKTQTLIDTLND
jgi:glycosyltransferase involved in cell wall biosynthesis